MAQRKQLPHSAQLYTISRTRIPARVLRPAGRHGAKFEVMFLAVFKHSKKQKKHKIAVRK